MPSRPPTRARRSPVSSIAREWPRAAVRRLGDVLSGRSPSATLTRFIARTTAASRVTRDSTFADGRGAAVGRHDEDGRERDCECGERSHACGTRSAVPAAHPSLVRGRGTADACRLVATASGRRRDRSPACFRPGSSRPARLSLRLGRRCRRALVGLLVGGVPLELGVAVSTACSADARPVALCVARALLALPCCAFVVFARFVALTALPLARAFARAAWLAWAPRFVFADFCAADELAFFVCPGASAFPRATPLPGTVTPRGATCPRRCPGLVAAGRVLAGFLASSDAPVTATPPATLTAATAAATLIATPPAKRPPPVAVAAPAPVPTPAAIEPRSGGDRHGRGACRSRAVEALEERERQRDRDEHEPAQRAAMPLLEARELRAVGALGEVVAHASALLASEPTVDRLRDGELRLGARELVRELFRERTPRAEEQRLERSRRHAEDLGDLGVRATLELAQDDRLTLLRRDLRKRGEQLADARAVVVRFLAGDALVELDQTWSRLLLPESLLDRVAGDGEEPVRRLARAHALLERAIGVQEGRLRDVLGVGVVAEHRVRVSVDLRAVAPIEVVDLARSEVAGLGDGHGLNRRRAARRSQPTSRILNTLPRKITPVARVFSYAGRERSPRQRRDQT